MVETHARPAGHVQRLDRARKRHEIVGRILGIDAHLDRVAARNDVLLAQAERRAAGDADHLGDQIDPGDTFRQRMLDLDAGVHLDEIETLGFVVIEIFDRAGAAITDRTGQRDRAVAQFAPCLRRECRRRRLLPHLLPAPLQRAFALEAVHRLAAVAEDLHLDMARAGNHLFQVKIAVAEGGERLGRRLGGQRFEVGRVLGDADAASTAAGSRLDHYRKADRFSRLPRLVQRDHAIAARDGRHTHPLRRRPGRRLVAHHADRVAARSDEDQPGVFDRVGEGGIFSQEAVSRMHCVGAAIERRAQHRIGGEIGFRRRRRADLDGLVGKPHGQRIGIGGTMGLNGPYALLARRADDAYRDLSAVGDEQCANGHGRAAPPMSPPGQAPGLPSPHPHCRRRRPSPCRRHRW